MIRLFVTMIVGLWLLTGCAALQDIGRKKTPSAEVHQASELCFVESQVDSFEHNCNFEYWINFWVEHDELSWPKRRAMIENLGNAPSDTLKKILLSQGRGTPYQNRLRAQSWADELAPSLTAKMQNIVEVLIYRSSQELLEFESALTILTRINTNQSKELDAQQQRLLEKQRQIDQLLKIEASMIEKREGINQ